MTEYFGILSKAVLDGDQEKVASTVQEAMDSGVSALDILDNGLVPGVQALGALFKDGQVYLPEILISTRAMSRVHDETMRRFAQAHLWRFASRQHAPDGAFAPEKHGYCENSQPALLQVFAAYDHPASKVAIMRSLPWMVTAQNEDGSWGEEPVTDAATWAVLGALDRVRDLLPAGLVP